MNGPDTQREDLEARLQGSGLELALRAEALGRMIALALDEGRRAGLPSALLADLLEAGALIEATAFPEHAPPTPLRIAVVDNATDTLQAYHDWTARPSA